MFLLLDEELLYTTAPRDFELHFLGLWAGVLAVIMDPSDGLAQMYVGSSGGEYAYYAQTISDANLYFSSWASQICALVLFAMNIWDRRGRTEGMGMAYTIKWCLLIVASSVLIYESIQFKNQVCTIEGGTEEATCVKTAYGLVAGEWNAEFICVSCCIFDALL